MNDSDWLADIEEAIEVFPDLRVLSDSTDDRRIGGKLSVVYEPEGLVIDTFEVEILYPAEYPKMLPQVWEVGGKIPREATRHVFTDTKALCFMFMVEEALYCRRGITTLKFLSEVLVPRLADEYNVSHGEDYSKELPHKLTDACWEFYRRTFKTNDNETVLKLLDQMVSGALPKGYELCPCNSGNKFKKCHRPVTLKLQQVKSHNAIALEKMTSKQNT